MIFKWFQRRKYRKFIKDSFAIAGSLIYKANSKNCDEIIKSLQEMLDEYYVKYGEDDIFLHYSNRLDYFRLVKRYKIEDELRWKKIEE